MRHTYRPIGLLLVALLVGCTPQGSTSPSTAGPEQEGASSSEQGQKAAATTPGKAGPTAGKATEAAGKQAARQSPEAVRQARAGLDQLHGKIVQLKQDAAKLPNTAQGEFQESINKLDREVQNAETRFEKLDKVSNEAWVRTWDDLQKAIGDVEKDYREAARVLEQPVASKTSAAKSTGTVSSSGSPAKASPTTSPTPSSGK